MRYLYSCVIFSYLSDMSIHFCSPSVVFFFVFVALSWFIYSSLSPAIYKCCSKSCAYCLFPWKLQQTITMLDRTCSKALYFHFSSSGLSGECCSQSSSFISSSMACHAKSCHHCWNALSSTCVHIHCLVCANIQKVLLNISEEIFCMSNSMMYFSVQTYMNVSAILPQCHSAAIC